MGIKVVLDNGGGTLPLSSVPIPGRISAVIKIEAQNPDLCRLSAAPTRWRGGNRVVAIGNPTGMQLAGQYHPGYHLRPGSGCQRVKTAIPCASFRPMRAINPGNSGGPLVNEDLARSSGINSAKCVCQQKVVRASASPSPSATPCHHGAADYHQWLKSPNLPMLPVSPLEPIGFSTLSRMAIPTSVHVCFDRIWTLMPHSLS